MKLSDIRNLFEQLDAEYEQAAQNGEEFPDIAQHRFDALPRVLFADLPASLKKQARERFQVQNLREFLREVMTSPEDEAEVKALTKEQRATLPFPAEGYVSFETTVKGIPERDLEKILIHTRNSAVYTIERERHVAVADGETSDTFIPMLYAPLAVGAFTATVNNYRSAPVETKTDKRTGKTTQHRKQLNHAARAIADKQIVSAGYYQFAISDPQYQHAMTTRQNQTAYIALMDTEFFQKLEFSNGELIYDDTIKGIVKQYTRGKYEDVSALDLPLLVQIYTAAVKSRMTHNDRTITVYIPKFFSEMGIDTGTGNAADILKKIHSFDNCVGVLPGLQIIAKLLSVIELDIKKQTMTLAIPYILRIISLLEEKNSIEGKTKKGEEYHYIEPHYNKLIHSTVAAERNKPAVELLYFILNGLLRRGATPDAKTYRKARTQTDESGLVTYATTYRTLLNDTAILRSRIQSYKTTSDKNKALQRAFSRMWELMDTQTDAGKYFIELKSARIVPTMAMLDETLTITHRGINGNYTPRK